MPKLYATLGKEFLTTLCPIRGFLRGVRDNGLGHEDIPFVVRASGSGNSAGATSLSNV
jgi:hypothetical protein